MTPKQALRRLDDLSVEKQKILSDERHSLRFDVPNEVSIEDVKPDYSYNDVSLQLNAIDDEMLKIKHALNVHNSTIVIYNDQDGDDFTTDQLIVKTAQMKNKLNRLNTIVSLKREHKRGGGYGEAPYYFWNEINVTEQQQESAKAELEALTLRLREYYDVIDGHNMTAQITI